MIVSLLVCLIFSFSCQLLLILVLLLIFVQLTLLSKVTLDFVKCLKPNSCELLKQVFSTSDVCKSQLFHFTIRGHDVSVVWCVGLHVPIEYLSKFVIINKVCGVGHLVQRSELFNVQSWLPSTFMQCGHHILWSLEQYCYMTESHRLWLNQGILMLAYTGSHTGLL